MYAYHPKKKETHKHKKIRGMMLLVELLKIAALCERQKKDMLYISTKTLFVI